MHVTADFAEPLEALVDHCLGLSCLAAMVSTWT